MKKLLAAALIAVLSGCITNGPKIDSARLEEFRVGQTTATQIFSQFGRPNFLSKNMDGTQTAVYVHAEDGPVVGTLAGTAETVTFSFDDRGVLSEVKYRPPGDHCHPQPPATRPLPAPPPLHQAPRRLPPRILQAARLPASNRQPQRDRPKLVQTYPICGTSCARPTAAIRAASRHCRSPRRRRQSRGGVFILPRAAVAGLKDAWLFTSSSC